MYNSTDGRIGPYELRGELGRGAMACVWRAWDPNLEREVAVKEPLFDPRLPQEVLDEMGRRFVAEGRAAARLSHPNIVTVYAADVWDGRPAIVMELVDGVTVRELLQNGPLEPAQALMLLDQLLDAVGYAHNKGVVHRDIKPDNVFVTRDGRVKLADFGIAHVDGGAMTRATVAGSVLGTPGYMSPEQARGVEVDARSDLFSVGVVAYEMLAGRNPFGAGEGGDSTALIYRIVHEPAPELPASASSGLPADLRPGVMAALAKDPANRPSSAAELKAMLHGNEPTVNATPAWGAASYGTASGPVRPKSRSWLPYAIVAGVAVVILAIVFANAMNATHGGTAAQPSNTSAATEAVDQVQEEQEAEKEQQQKQPEESPAQETKKSQDKAADNADADQEQVYGSPYFVAASNGVVSIFSNSSAKPYETTDVSVTDLSEESQALLDEHIPVDSIEDAVRTIEGLRTEANTNRKEREAREEAARIEAEAKANPPIFTATDASSVLPPDKITSYYGPNNAVDSNYMTAWNEGAEGSGVGEWICVTADSPQWTHGVRLVTGYPKSEDVYYKNNRVRDATIELSDGYTASITLNDAYREYQEFDFGDYHQTTYIRITIDSVYEGSTWQDASICEIQAY